ncbi:hypothetical protein EVAR_42579_1 [Eumeta japonica]|uniref:Uncharacterized protein n=1 Tax=Eumeta variegata TaxID=151549 RepID=A0A4C1ZSS6_EUMVA|nr:hypothetical protein EVAR_42579_1 [Eumeta japonica]
MSVLTRVKSYHTLRASGTALSRRYRYLVFGKIGIRGKYYRAAPRERGGRGLCPRHVVETSEVHIPQRCCGRDPIRRYDITSTFVSECAVTSNRSGRNIAADVSASVGGSRSSQTRCTVLVMYITSTSRRVCFRYIDASQT